MTEESREFRNSENENVISRVLSIMGIIFSIILIPIVVINLVMIIQSFSSESLPQFGGVLPQVVMTGSMSPEIEAGDLILSKQADPEVIQVGDIITFYDPAGDGKSIETHRVTEITEDEKGVRSFITKGDSNNTDDAAPVPADDLIARYEGTRLPGAGNVILFLQTARGIILCVLLPLLLFIGYDLIRRRLYDKRNKRDTAALMDELERLRAANMKAAQS